MKARGAAIQGTLALVGLVAAYAAWQREPEVGAEEAVVLDLSRSELEKIRFDDGTRWAVLERRRDEGEAQVWMRSGSRPPPPPPVAAATDGGTPLDGGVASTDGGTPTPPQAVATPTEPEKPEREVKTNDQAERLLERFTPLRASRSLGALGPDKLKELGLEGSNRKLEVVARGKTYAFTVAAAGGSPYVLDTQDGKVYLVSSSLLTDLDSAANRLVDRRIHTFRQAEVDTISVALGDKRREFQPTVNEQGIVTRMVAKATPDKADDFAKNWLDRIWRLIPVDILGKGELPPGGNPTMAAKVEYSHNGKVKGWTELARVGKNELYIRSEHTASWVKVHLPADDLLNDATKVAAGQ